MQTVDIPHSKSDYERLVTSIAAKLVTFIKEDRDDPEYITQRQAKIIFGHGNIDRWLKAELIQPHRQGGRIYYRTALLNELRRTPVDYRDTIPKELQRVAKKLK